MPSHSAAHAWHARLTRAVPPILLAACAPATRQPARVAPEPRSVDVDARTGALEGALVRLGTRDRVVVRVRHVNPFVHQYRARGTSTTYTESAIAEFAKLLGFGGITIPKAPEATALGSQQLGAQMAPVDGAAAEAAAAIRAAECAAVPADVAAAAGVQTTVLIGERHRAFASAAALRVWLDSVRISQEGTGRAVANAGAALRDPTLSTDELRARVGQLAGMARAYADTLQRRREPLREAVTDFVRRAADLAVRADAVIAKFPTCRGPAKIRDDAGVLIGDTLTYRGLVARHAEHGDAMQALVATLTAVVTAPEALTLTYAFGGYQDPTAIELQIQRSPIGRDTVWRTVASPRLAFGPRRRFAVGVGGVAHWIPTADYGTVQRYRASPATPADSVERVIVQTASSTRQVAPLATLTARLAEVPRSWLDGVHLMVGTAPRAQGSGVTLDYFAGAALSAADERVMLGAGLVSAEEQRLASGLRVDQRVPLGQTSGLTRKTRVAKPGVTLSFRVF